MANLYPDNEYRGIDLVEIYPTTNIPPNVLFAKADILDDDGLPFDNNTFDFVNMRFLSRHFNTNQWRVAIEEMARVTKEFGFIEIMEIDLTSYNQGPVTRKLYEACK